MHRPLRPQSQTYKQVSDDQIEQVSSVLKNTTNGRKTTLSEATHIEEKQHTGAHPLAINIQGYRSVHIGKQIPRGATL